MTDPINSAINELERKQSEISTAIGVLKRLQPQSVTEPVRKGITEAGRRRISAAQKRRWKAIKAA